MKDVRGAPLTLTLVRRGGVVVVVVVVDVTVHGKVTCGSPGMNAHDAVSTFSK